MRTRHLVFFTSLLAIGGAFGVDRVRSYRGGTSTVTTGSATESTPTATGSAAESTPTATGSATESAPTATGSTAESTPKQMFVVVAGHFDGINKMSSSTLASWIEAADAHASAMRAAGYLDTWELTAGEVSRIEGARPGWLSDLSRNGVTIVPREPHAGDGSAAESASAIARAGLPTSAFLGSVLNPSVYVGGAWSLLGVGAVPGHTADSDVSGIGPLEGGLYGFYAGTGNSVAIKRKIASLVAKGSLPSAFELIRYNGADPRTGAAPWFASPARHGGSQAPVPIVEDIDRVMTDIRRDGNGGFVRFSTYAEALTYWSMSRPSTYVIPKTGE